MERIIYKDWTIKVSDHCTFVDYQINDPKGCVITFADTLEEAKEIIDELT